MKKFCKIQTMLSALFILVIVSQGCSVYHKPVKAWKAIDKGPVKVYYEDDVPEKFKNLEQDRSEIYGIRGKGNFVRRITINRNEVRYVKIKDRTASAILNIFGIAVGTTAIVSSVIVGSELSGLSSMGGWGGGCLQPGNGIPPTATH